MLKIKLIFLALFLMTAAIALLPKNKNMLLNNGMRVHVTVPHFWREIFPEANANIRVKTTVGKVGNVSLWQDEFDGPIYALPGTNTNLFFVLYDFDTCFCLFRIDTGLSFQPVPTNCFLKNILFASDWQIREANGAEWQEAIEDLKKTSRTDFRRQWMQSEFRIGLTPQTVLDRMRYQPMHCD